MTPRRLRQYIKVIEQLRRCLTEADRVAMVELWRLRNVRSRRTGMKRLNAA